MLLDQRKYELALLLFILLVAAGTRLWRLESVPPGYTHDEAGHRQDALAIVNGARPIYQTVGYGREPLYDYVVAGAMALLSPAGSTLRILSVVLGLATLVLTYLWVRLAFDVPIALTSVMFQAASFWSLATSRQALRSSLLPPLFVAAVLVFWRLYRAPSRSIRWKAGHLGVFALLLGGTLYTYISARVLWALFPAMLVYLALFHRAVFRRLWLPTAAGVLIGLLLAVPLFAYLQEHPGVEQRLAMLDEPLVALQNGDVSVVLGRVQSALAALVIPGRGDDFLAYNIPGRPIFDPLTGVLFVIGLGLCLARWRTPTCAFSLLWLLIGLSPSLITGASASFTRSIGAMPVLFVFPALAAVATVRWMAVRFSPRIGWGAVVGVVSLAILTGTLAVEGYFVTWGQSVNVRVAYQHTVVEMADYLDRHPEARDVAISSAQPYAPHDPYVMETALRRDDLSLRWFDGRRAMVIRAQRSSWLLIPSSSPLDSYFADLPGLSLQDRVTLNPEGSTYFLRYIWQPQVTLGVLREQVKSEPMDLAPPVDFGGALQLLGYDLRTTSVPVGGMVELVTLWQATAPERVQPADPADVDEELVFFTHALNQEGAVVGQEDRLDAPTWDWQNGDVIAQIHRFPLQADVPPGPVLLEIGAYRRADLVRLPVLVDGAIAADRVLLETVEVVRQ